MDYLKVTQSLKIIPDDVAGISSGTITKVNPEHFIVASGNLKPEYFKINDCIELCISRGDCLISFKSDVIDLYEKNIVCTLPKNTKYIQRREYSRVDMSIPVQLAELHNSKNTIILTTKNISGGGMKLISENKFDVGTLFEVRFCLMDNKIINTIFEVLRVERNEKNKIKCVNEEYYLSGKFKEISGFDRSTIVQSCFKRLLELNCKGLTSNQSAFGGE